MKNRKDKISDFWKMETNSTAVRAQINILQFTQFSFTRISAHNFGLNCYGQIKKTTQSEI